VDGLPNARRVLDWLLRAREATGGRGFAAYRRLLPFRRPRWGPPYPEVSGYLIPTLLRYDELFPHLRLAEKAEASARWLCRLQRPEGALPGGTGEAGPPSVFNTGMILLGLTAAARRFDDPAFPEAAARAARWLVYTYRPQAEPTYFARVVGALLRAQHLLNDPAIPPFARQALDELLTRRTEAGSFRAWGFGGSDTAFTHTLLYSLRGLWESSLLLEYPQGLEAVQQAVQQLLEDYAARGRLAGRYDTRWQGDHAFRCLTGEAQLAVLLRRMHAHRPEPAYRNTARRLLQGIPLARNGGIAGLAPPWGGYQPFRQLSWAAKFYLDGHAAGAGSL
jgi:hypothetical protein